MPKIKNTRYEVGSGEDTIRITFPYISTKGSLNGVFKCYVTCRRWATETNREGRVRHSTGILLPVEYWDKVKNDVKGTYRKREAIRSQLHAIVERIRQAFMVAESNRVGQSLRPILSEEDVKGIIEGKADFRTYGSLQIFVRNHSIKNGNEFGGLLGEFMRRYVSSDGRKLIEMNSHYKNFRTLAHNLEVFMAKYYALGFSINRVEDDLPEFVKKWFRYQLYDEVAASSSINTMTKGLRQVLQWGIDENYIPLISLKCLRFKLTKHPKIALPLEALCKLYQHKFSVHEERIERARDLFVLACLTALRFKDLWNLDKASTVDEDAIHVPTAKDGGSVIIPLFPAIKQILAKHGGVPRTNFKSEIQRLYWIRRGSCPPFVGAK